LFIWEFIITRLQIIFDLGSAKLPADQLARDSTLAREPPPAWIWEYLGEVAFRLRELMEGRDFRQDPTSAGEEAADYQQAYQRYRSSVRLPPAKAPRLLALALGITRVGWNAFAEWQRIQKAERASDAREQIRRGELNRSSRTRREAVEKVMAEFGFADDRGFRRFLKKGRLPRRPPLRVKPP
jgi:hypothetical protein